MTAASTIDVKSSTLIINWSGSHLGTFKVQEINDKTVIGDLCLWTITRGDVKFTAHVRCCKDQFPCIADELKPIFGLMKLGTHMLCIGSKSYLLIKPGNYQDHPLPSVDLDTALLIKQVRSIYTFRYLIGINTSQDSHLRLCKRNGFPLIPISYRDSDLTSDKHSKKAEANSLSQTVMKRWFNGCELGTSVCSMVNWDQKSSLEANAKAVLIMKFRGQIEAVITRVNREFIWLAVFIIDRILVHILD